MTIFGADKQNVWVFVLIQFLQPIDTRGRRDHADPQCLHPPRSAPRSDEICRGTPPEGEDLTETGKAEMLGLTRARLHALRKGRVEQFSLDALVKLAMRLGLTVRMSMTRFYRRAGTL